MWAGRDSARIGVGRRHVTRRAGPHRVHAVVRPGRAEARLDHVAEAEAMHQVPGARRGGEAGEVVRLGQALAVQRVLAVQHAEVVRPVARVNGVVELDVGGVDFGVNHRNAGRPLLADLGDEEGVRGHAADEHLIRVEIVALHPAARAHAHREIIPADPERQGQLPAGLPLVLRIEAV